MHRRDMLALAGASAMAAMTGATAAGPPTDLARRVRELVDRYAAAWKAMNMGAMSALYTDDVHWVNIVGMHWQGRAEVDHAHRVFGEMMFKGVEFSLQEIESVVPLPGGGAVAVVRWSVGAFRTPTGFQNPPSRDRMTLVLVPRGDRLLIAHGANIAINEEAQASDPVRQGAAPSTPGG